MCWYTLTQHWRHTHNQARRGRVWYQQRLELVRIADFDFEAWAGVVTRDARVVARSLDTHDEPVTAFDPAPDRLVTP